MMRRIFGFVLAACLVAATAGGAEGGVIVGGSDLLSAGDVAQLELWLGEGPLTLTNVFDKATGDTAADFHAAADGLGATFSVIEIISAGGNPDRLIVGGYNPHSWDVGLGGFRYTAPGDRDAFLFNLTDTEVRYQNPTDVLGEYQTVNHPGHGPSFGYGVDLYVSGGLSTGSSYASSYGTETGGIQIGYAGGLAGTNGSLLTYGQIEVFTVSNAASVPEPASFALLGIGGLGLCGFRCRRKRTPVAFDSPTT